MSIDIRAKADRLAASFETEWGAFRRFIATRPLTAFWIGVVAGSGLGWLVGKVL